MVRPTPALLCAMDSGMLAREIGRFARARKTQHAGHRQGSALSQWTIGVRSARCDAGFQPVTGVFPFGAIGLTSKPLFGPRQRRDDPAPNWKVARASARIFVVGSEGLPSVRPLAYCRRGHGGWKPPWLPGLSGRRPEDAGFQPVSTCRAKEWAKALDLLVSASVLDRLPASQLYDHDSSDLRVFRSNECSVVWVFGIGRFGWDAGMC